MSVANLLKRTADARKRGNYASTDDRSRHPHQVQGRAELAPNLISRPVSIISSVRTLRVVVRWSNSSSTFFSFASSGPTPLSDSLTLIIMSSTTNYLFPKSQQPPFGRISATTHEQQDH